jgi:hypothetical protein
MVKKEAVISMPLTVRIFSGIIGTINLLVIKTVIMEAEPKSRAALTFTNPFLKLFAAPIKLVDPTTNKE